MAQTLNVNSLQTSLVLANTFLV